MRLFRKKSFFGNQKSILWPEHGNKVVSSKKVKSLTYTVMQSDRNSSKRDTFHRPTTYEPHAYTSSDKMITFA